MNKITAPLVLTDLDDTLFQTLRKIPEGIDRETLTPASWLKDGSVSGYMTQLQSLFHGWLAAGEVVPVTARTKAVLDRTFLKGCGRAICSHGGLILDKEGSPERAWTEHLSSLDTASPVPVSEAYRMLEERLAEHGDLFRYWMVSEEGVNLYVSVKQNYAVDGHPSNRLHEVAAELARLLPGDWKLHRNGNNAAFMPSWLGKRQAVEHLLAGVRHDDPLRPVIGFGDSTSDLPFMGLCDYLMTPSRGQIAAILGAASADHF
ncbi:sucrose-6-phosphate hydrolase [Sphingomonas sp. 3-13AW]|uniref:sucrose-6-phosphate hydrolase n=1 Tax=Sphingomonas sp. 3-13AW TaxID=3050450 RepID=UPI003BB6943D